MNAVQLSLADALPLARTSDPHTSHEAARTVTPGNGALIQAIRQTLIAYGPLSAFDIADYILEEHGNRWDEGTIRTAVPRVAGVQRHHFDAVSPRGNRCSTYFLATDAVQIAGDRL